VNTELKEQKEKKSEGKKAEKQTEICVRRVERDV
jgi:hypothetical protein